MPSLKVCPMPNSAPVTIQAALPMPVSLEEKILELDDQIYILEGTFARLVPAGKMPSWKAERRLNALRSILWDLRERQRRA
jgi:hypothetical protein